MAKKKNNSDNPVALKDIPDRFKKVVPEGVTVYVSKTQPADGYKCIGLGLPGFFLVKESNQ
jgi:hypothetical protein